jgi:hypothetical protein
VNEVMWLIARALAKAFVEEDMLRSIAYLRDHDLRVDDDVDLPRGKLVKVTVEYADEGEAE